MTIERPMFSPRAESVDSFSLQPAIGQPESQTITSDSPKPAESGVVRFPGKPKDKPADRKSAIAGVRRSGFDLVPHQKLPKDKIATQEQCAKMAFKPWKKDDKDLEVFGGDNWHDHGVYVRLAYALMLMSRDEMIEFHRDTDGDQVDLLFANIFDTAEFLKYVAAMAETAVGRLMASGCAALERGVIGDGKQPVRLEGFQARPMLVSSKKLR
jgi:hypothetical protein